MSYESVLVELPQNIEKIRGCVWMNTHAPHIAAVCCFSSFSAFLPISLARETGDADPVL